MVVAVYGRGHFTIARPRCGTGGCLVESIFLGNLWHGHGFYDVTMNGKECEKLVGVAVSSFMGRGPFEFMREVWPFGLHE